MTPTPFMDYQTLVVHLGSPDIKSIEDIKATVDIVTSIPKSDGVTFLSGVARSVKNSTKLVEGDLFLLLCRMQQGGCLYLHGSYEEDDVSFPDNEFGVRDFVVKAVEKKFPDFDYGGFDFTPYPGVKRSLFVEKK